MAKKSLTEVVEKNWKGAVQNELYSYLKDIIDDDDKKSFEAFLEVFTGFRGSSEFTLVTRMLKYVHDELKIAAEDLGDAEYNEQAKKVFNAFNEFYKTVDAD